jgi:enoyl-CoA hydratase/carnithine racemase
MARPAPIAKRLNLSRCATPEHTPMAKTAAADVLYEVIEGVGVVTLNRPDKLNAITEPMKFAIIDTFALADKDPCTSVVILRGAGRSFCAGHDISGDDDEGDGSWRTDAMKWHQHLTGSVRSEMAPFEISKPVIASVQGHVLGGGCQLAMFCDLIIAAENAVFAEPEVRFSNTGPAFIMPWIAGFRRAREFIYFGDTINAATALSYGLVNRVVPNDELAAATLAYAKRLSLIAPEALTRTKLALKRGLEATGFRQALNAGHDVISTLYAAETEVGRQFSEIAERDGLKAALTWRAGQFKI